jgi:hypothetical protein
MAMVSPGCRKAGIILRGCAWTLMAADRQSSSMNTVFFIVPFFLLSRQKYKIIPE